jgi:hypothetical protein
VYKMSEEGLAVLGDTLPRKLSFIFFSVLVSANLILLSIILASHKSPSATGIRSTSIAGGLQPVAARIYKSAHTFRFFFSSARGLASFGLAVSDDADYLANSTWDITAHLGRDVHGGLHSMALATAHVSRSAVKATSLNAIIRPADYTDIPVITPIASTSATIISHATVPVSVQPHVPVQQASPIKIAAAVPIPQADTTNTYAWGNCTWWASERRADTNDQIPNSWGNAATWAVIAAAEG